MNTERFLLQIVGLFLLLLSLLFIASRFDPAIFPLFLVVLTFGIIFLACLAVFVIFQSAQRKKDDS